MSIEAANLPKLVAIKQLVPINLCCATLCHWHCQPACGAPAKTGAAAAATAATSTSGTKGVGTAPNWAVFALLKPLAPAAPKDVPQVRQIIEASTSALRQNPNDIKTLLERSRSYMRLRDWQHCGQDCEQALKLKPGNVEAAMVAYMLAGAYNADLDEDNALHFFDVCIRACPNQSGLYCERGKLLHGMDRNKEALADETKAVALDPSNYRAYFARGEIESAAGDMKSAIVDFGKGVPLNPEPFVPYLRKAQCYEALKQWKNAVDCYTKILPLKGIDITDRLKTRVRLANDLVAVGDAAGALVEFTAVIDTPKAKAIHFKRNTQSGELSEALLGRAHIYTAQKKYDLAVKDYTKLIGVDEDWGDLTPQWYLQRAKIYRLMGKNELAKRDEELAKK